MKSGADFAKAIERLYEYQGLRTLEPWAELWADASRVTFPFATDHPDVVGKPAIVASTAVKFAERGPADLTLEIEPLAQSRRVLVRMHLVQHSDNAPSIAGPLLVIFSFDETGKIVLQEEYFDSRAFRQL